MSLSIVERSRLLKIPGGDGGCIVERGLLTWNGTDASGELAVKLNQIHSAKFTPVGGAPAGDEEVYIDETPSADVVAVPSTGTITLGRTGTPTSGQQYFYELTGV